MQGGFHVSPTCPFPTPAKGAWEQWLGGAPTLGLASQEGTAAPSSPGSAEAAAEVEARRRGEEQAYVAGLASLYRLEQYPDSYESMCESLSPGGKAGSPDQHTSMLQ